MELVIPQVTKDGNARPSTHLSPPQCPYRHLKYFISAVRDFGTMFPGQIFQQTPVDYYTYSKAHLRNMELNPAKEQTLLVANLRVLNRNEGSLGTLPRFARSRSMLFIKSTQLFPSSRIQCSKEWIRISLVDPYSTHAPMLKDESGDQDWKDLREGLPGFIKHVAAYPERYAIFTAVVEPVSTAPSRCSRTGRRAEVHHAIGFCVVHFSTAGVARMFNLLLHPRYLTLESQPKVTRLLVEFAMDYAKERGFGIFLTSTHPRMAHHLSGPLAFVRFGYAKSCGLVWNLPHQGMPFRSTQALLLGISDEDYVRQIMEKANQFLRSPPTWSAQLPFRPAARASRGDDAPTKTELVSAERPGDRVDRSAGTDTDERATTPPHTEVGRSRRAYDPDASDSRSGMWFDDGSFWPEEESESESEGEGDWETLSQA
ncbi:hypothetical protein F5Y15DRAFT_141342 [Xylariaceae sp. FL0016]|nr:hypothetical protein F5Y15DRAFT_141342 [Xylariaceae sp. FL0016]